MNQKSPIAQASEEQRQLWLLEAVERSTHIEWNGHLLAITSVDEEENAVLADDLESQESGRIMLDDFLRDRDAKVYVMTPTFLNSLEDPRMAVYSVRQSAVDDLVKSASDLMNVLTMPQR